MDAAIPLIILGSGLLIAPFRRRAGIRTVWALLAGAWLLDSWLSARAWDAALRAGQHIIDYGPRDERWAITAGLLAAGAVAMQLAVREVTGGNAAPIGRIATLERVIIEAFLESAAAFVVFVLGGIGAGAAISRPLSVNLAIYAVFLTAQLARSRPVLLQQTPTND